jgi:hypothetical protein
MFKYSLEQVKEFYTKRGCVFLDDEFLGVMHKHNYLCSCGNKSNMTLNNFFKGKNCKKCGFKKHEYTLEEVREIFAKQNAKLISTEYKGYNGELEFICSCGRFGKRTFTQFKKSKNCEACSYESWAYTLEELQKLFESKCFKLLETEAKGVNFPYKCVCKCGKETKKSWSSLSKGKGCQICQLENSKFSLEEAKTIYASYGWILLDDFYVNNSYLNNAICKCGNKTTKRLNDLKRFPGCRKCGGNYIPTVNELKKEFVEKDCEYLDDFYINSHYAHRYLCKCGKESKISINNWRNGKRCKECGNTLVYDMTLPSNVYLLGREGQFKIGKNNRKSWRLVIHKNNGWKVLDKIGPIVGNMAHDIEKTIKVCLKKKNIPTGTKAGLDKFDGSSEVWLDKDFHVESLSDLWGKL